MTVMCTESTARPTARPSCQCIHPMPWGEVTCHVDAAFEVGLEDRTVLLCDPCLEGWREADLNRYGSVRLTAREL